MRTVWEILVMIFLGICLKKIGATKPAYYSSYSDLTHCYCLSWRLGVESNNVRAWRTVPTQCLRYVQFYMLGGQYESDLELIVEQIYSYIDEILLTNTTDTRAWILDVDDTCISNLLYYTGKRFGCDPFDPMGFKTWAIRGECPAIPAVLRLFRKLIQTGFKVFLLTGRDEETLGQPTIQNLHSQGFVGYERLILRTRDYKGKSAVSFKSAMRKQLVEQGYTIWGSVGDQWSDLVGDCLGERTFKLPNPMYFVP
ncbi:acid phosphatase [Thalictrum thalictroides]|uniref:Acid phosphatase n=1 Tax=Thalictrum thalictroides TaxID=46969 RepID=A0A7J6UWH9_THATH|nr:acid phosphatase [Thalictrum thalictroides]